MKVVKTRTWKVVKCGHHGTKSRLGVEDVLNLLESQGWTMVNIIPEGYTGSLSVFFARIDEVAVPLTDEEIAAQSTPASDGEELVVTDDVVDDTEAATQAFAADVMTDGAVEGA